MKFAPARWLVYWLLSMLSYSTATSCAVAAERLEQRLANEVAHLHRFASGDTHPLAKAALAKALAAWSDHPTVQPVLRQQVRPLGPTNLQTADLAFSVVRPDGALVPPPTIPGETGERLDALAAEFSGPWREVAQAVANDTVVPGTAVERLHATLVNWTPVTLEQVDVETIRRRNVANQYVVKLRALSGALEQPARLARLVTYLRHEGFAFPGGNVGQLALFAFEHNLAPTPSSEAQAELVKLVEVLAPLVKTANAEKLAATRATREREFAVRQAKYDRQAQRVAMVYAAQQAYVAECKRYLAHYYRQYTAPSTSVRTHTYTVRR